jgi:hypothetical protein
MLTFLPLNGGAAGAALLAALGAGAHRRFASMATAAWPAGRSARRPPAGAGLAGQHRALEVAGDVRLQHRDRAVAVWTLGR